MQEPAFHGSGCGFVTVPGKISEEKGSDRITFDNYGQESVSGGLGCTYQGERVSRKGQCIFLEGVGTGGEEGKPGETKR